VAQTCCGQPAYNTGDRADTREIAEQVIEAFEVSISSSRRRDPAPRC
jgi:Fe-S oxidoreductase